MRGKQRVKEAFVCLKLSGHDPYSGLLLDLGCGAGYLLKWFMDNGINVVGLELGKPQLMAAKKALPDANLVLADGCHLPFKEECFNTVISNDVLEHVPYGLAGYLFNEVSNALKPDGFFYFSVANKFQINEPHTLIPFLTWFPRPCWEVIHKFLKGCPMPGYGVYPYTFRMVRSLCRKTKFSHTNFTWLYTLYKTSNIDYIGNPTVRKIAQTLKKSGLLRPAQILAEKLSIIVFVCRKQ